MSEKVRSRASKGGLARAAKLSAEERKQIGIAGSLARWGKNIPSARYGSPDRPLRLGATELPCYVLEDGRRVLLQEGFLESIGIRCTEGGPRTGQRAAEMIERLTALPDDIGEGLRRPLLIRLGRSTAYGYEAHLLADVHTAIVQRNPGRKPTGRQARVIEAVEALTPWISGSDPDRMVDEAAGVESAQRGEALARPLADLVQDELRDWVGSFPPEYYEELYRLCRLDPSSARAMPRYLGELTDDVIYKRLGPGTRDELTRLADSRDATSGSGGDEADTLASPRLREHLASVIALMKISSGYEEFERHLDTALPRWSDGEVPPPSEG